VLGQGGIVPREQRVITACQVEFDKLGQRVQAVTEDLSRHGAFVRTSDFLPIGEVVELLLHMPRGRSVPLIARVAHIMSEQTARALGRTTGMGFELLEQDAERRRQLVAFLEEMVEEATPLPQELPRQVRVLVADGSTKILERLSTALDDAGFQVDIAASGAEAYSLAMGHTPELVLVADEMPVMDGWAFIKMMGQHPRLAEIPVTLMSQDGSDMNRLRAYRLGVRDFLQKPFTDEEVCIRLRRIVTSRRPPTDFAALRGSVKEIGLQTLLSLLEFERKSGILSILRDAEVARLFVAEGRIVKVEASGASGTGAAGDAAAGSDARTKLMRILDWKEGNFEFVATEIVGADEVGTSTSFLLLEHARVRDEEAAASRAVEKSSGS
jgi:CheY-like chemotaxis protein/Tfp pilus assembly protein PilZ